METILSNLLEKAKAAHYHWITDNSVKAFMEAMAELGDAIQDTEAMQPKPELYDIGPSGSWRERSKNGDIRLFQLYLSRHTETKVMHVGLRIRTFTTNPQRYMHERILRKGTIVETGETYYYIEFVVNLRYDIWLMCFNGIKELMLELPKWEEYLKNHEQ